ncbi:MAG: hypothetical protein FWD54_07075 [Endomicrobia bacterium]|nr:hypothetical protein [Endomicrobiia bacterium]MCL2800015.1 hypothetical protein [Endomicrobiia bacterium]
MIKKITAVFIISSVFYCGAAYAGLQKQAPYKPPSEKQFRELQTIFPNFSDKDIEKSIKLSKNPENIDLINDILIFLQYKGLIKQTKKLPPIFLIYSENNQILAYKGGMYYDNENIILLNANLLMANNKQQELPKNIQDAIDFVVFSSILSHELMHYEDFLEVKDVQNMDAFALSEWKAYKRSEKTLNYFLKMSKAEADELIPISGFHNTIQVGEEYFTDMRKNYIKMAQAADIFLNKKDKILKTFGIDENMFKMISFFPQLQFNAKYGGHIIRLESNLFNFGQKLKFDVNILTGALDILNTPQEIKAIKDQAKNIQIIDKRSYLIIR